MADAVLLPTCMLESEKGMVRAMMRSHSVGLFSFLLFVVLVLNYPPYLLSNKISVLH